MRGSHLRETARDLRFEPGLSISIRGRKGRPPRIAGFEPIARRVESIPEMFLDF
jgi:hypothetical protein